MKQPKAERDPVMQIMENLGETTDQINQDFYDKLVSTVIQHWETHDEWREYPAPNPKPLIAQALANAVLMLNDEAISNIGAPMWQDILSKIQIERSGCASLNEAMNEAAENLKRKKHGE